MPRFTQANTKHFSDAELAVLNGAWEIALARRKRFSFGNATDGDLEAEQLDELDAIYERLALAICRVWWPGMTVRQLSAALRDRGY